MPKQAARVAVDIAASLPGMEGAVDIRLEGDKAKYQQAISKLGPLLKAAEEVDGTLTVTLDFGEDGVAPTDDAYTTVDTVIRGLGPSEVTVDGTVA